MHTWARRKPPLRKGANGDFSTETNIITHLRLARQTAGGKTMEIAQETREGIQVFQVQGKIDASTADSFEESLIRSIDEGNTRLVVDMAEVDYISSVGLRVFLLAAKKLKPLDGKIVLAAMQGPIRKVFTMAAFDRILPIADTTEVAIQEMS
ncbi:MAG: anti-anti-sigma factor [Armatimonadetes bacterium CG07_land_8_20_14_0_80_59_28]|nr:MAG: anti-anti-sigma factor [Armatimonadetes bacterium CG07_land_8_20_14_0_80_59_28]PIX40115.1 MAG: anti-anti-sigma factor [Armatimonadetes bacterium CG_4_8_14_3_um_filter_58_9]PIY38701.1 MAG: anti-anti-sigma factor [Armatimonadetes bacterium CG_4_10_14_3_um_filter_59_10]PJB75957.1 MAG: anti-anti-sigma factor [Armatimonadetes bacterium CG_4_9_14_3_um_filter_58_7]